MHKFGHQVLAKLNPEVASGCMQPAPNRQNTVVILCLAKQDQLDKAKCIEHCRPRNLAVYKKENQLCNID